MNPLVSVIIPIYNMEKYLQECVNSVVNQSYQNLEIILVDDGSNDNSGKICDILKKQDKRIKVFHNYNQGVSYSRNFGIKKSNGKYLLALDGDDTIDSTYIEKGVYVLENNINIGIVYCKARLFGYRDEIWNLPEYSLDKMLVENIIFVTALFRKSDFIIVGGFCEDMKYGIEDYDFWLSILELKREVYMIPEILFNYRIRNNSRNSQFGNNYDHQKEMYLLIYNRHKKLYIENYEAVMEGFINKYITLNKKINYLKTFILFYYLIKNSPKIKKILKNFLNIKFK